MKIQYKIIIKIYINMQVMINKKVYMIYIIKELLQHYKIQNQDQKFKMHQKKKKNN